MDGLHLGLIGGSVVGLATICGILFIFIKSYFKKISLLNLKLDFLIGFLLSFASVNLLYSSHESKNINHGILALGFGFLFFIITKFLLNNILAAIIFNDIKDRDFVFIILFNIFKNIPIGLAAGAIMHLKHLGEGYSLLSGIACHNFFDGIALGVCFISFGVNIFQALLGAIGISILVIVASLCGGFLIQDNLEFLPTLMGFSGGILMGSSLLNASILALKEYKKLAINPKIASGLGVILIFIFWKELL